MPLQNRVLPTGAIVADPARGLFTGNRGILHRPDRTLGRARWKGRLWICCRLDWPGLRRVPMSPGTWTELFFLDEAVALAAGHRPCAFCRRGDHARFRAAWAAAGLPGRLAAEMDRLLHPARTRRDWAGATHRAAAGGLPDGAFVVLPGGGPALIRGQRALPFSPAGYGAPLPRPSGPVGVLTPAPLVAVLLAGYRPVLHPTAGP
ncbi:MAG: hypothetical protein N2422_10735 [Rhodobacteraceae bacterium]|nr:hypothetical protein [Paracoccaceae bacterium]